jgi:hypothetical protein
MSHQSRNQRTLPPFDKITTHCRHAFFGIISPLIVVTVAGMPAMAQQFQLIGFAEAQAHGDWMTRPRGPRPWRGLF